MSASLAPPRFADRVADPGDVSRSTSDLALARARRADLSVAVVFVDLEGFGSLNERLGRPIGDEVLRQAADRLVEATRETDLVARQGADEFLVLVADLERGVDGSDRALRDAQGVGDRVVQAFLRPFRVGGLDCRCRISLHISVFPEDGRDAPALLSRADAARSVRVRPRDAAAAARSLASSAVAVAFAPTSCRHELDRAPPRSLGQPLRKGLNILHGRGVPRRLERKAERDGDGRPKRPARRKPGSRPSGVRSPDPDRNDRRAGREGDASRPVRTRWSVSESPGCTRPSGKMPATAPDRIVATASSSAFASPAWRTIGIWSYARRSGPAAERNVSAATRKRIGRPSRTGGRQSTGPSSTLTWFAANSAGPAAGMRSASRIRRRKTRRQSGPTSASATRHLGRSVARSATTLGCYPHLYSGLVDLEKIRAAAHARHDAFVRDLQEMVNVDCGSYSPRGVNVIADLCERRFQAGGWMIDRLAHEPGEGKPQLGDLVIGVLPGSGGPRVLMIGHTDTVFDDGTVAERPFRVEGDRAFGPGTSDMKGGLLAGFFAVELLQELGVDDFGGITFVCNPDEEIGSPFSGPVIRELASTADIGLVMESARENGDVVSARKGITDLTIELAGRAAHAGVEPELGRSAVVEAAHKTIELHALNGRWPGVSVNVGVIGGGTRTNVVAERCALEVDLRAADESLPRGRRGGDPPDLCHPRPFRTSRSTLYEHGWHRPMERTAASERLVDLAIETAAELGMRVRGAATGGASDANTTSAAGVPTLDGLGPVGGAAHARGEWLDLAGARGQDRPAGRAAGAGGRRGGAGVSRAGDAREPRDAHRGRASFPAHRLWEGLEGAEAYRALAEGVPAILYIDAIDEFSTTLYTSPQVGSILGYDAEEWLDRPSIWLELLHPDDRERVLALHEESNTRGEEFHAEYRLIARDGHEVWFRDEAVLVRDEQGAPLFWRGVMLDITEQKLAEERLRRSLDILRRTMQQRRVLVARLEEAQEEERRRIAGDIHDDPVQVMSAADLRIQTLAGRLEDPQTSAALEEVHHIVENAIERLRHLLFELRPPSFGELGLAGALQAYLRHVGDESGFAGAVESRLSAEPPPEVAAIMFRIAQEAITNARKHARATRVDIALEEREGGVAIRIVDDGRGFEPSTHEPRPGHLGMSAMEERAELAGGWCRIDSAPGRGTVVESWVPAVDTIGEGGNGERSA